MNTPYSNDGALGVAIAWIRYGRPGKVPGTAAVRTGSRPVSRLDESPGEEPNPRVRPGDPAKGEQ